MSSLFRGGHVYRAAEPRATALLVAGDRIAWLGTDDAAAGLSLTPDHVVELDGALLAPAFVDAHVHATDTGLTLAGSGGGRV